MKKYYVGPIKKAVVKSIEKDNKNNFKFDLDISMIEKEVLFYRNYMDVLIKNDTKCPIIREEELYDLFQYSLQNDDTKKYSFIFVDEKELKKINSKPKTEKSKSLIKKLQNIRNNKTVK